MQNDSGDDQDHKLWMLLNQTRHAIYKTRSYELRSLGISPIQARVFLILKSANAAVTPAEISRHTLREPHTISALLRRMERRGLVQMSKDLERKNLIKVTITEKGQAAYELSTKGEAIHHIMSSLSQEERQRMYVALEVLLEKALVLRGIRSKPPLP